LTTLNDGLRLLDMSNTPTILADNEAPARPGTLGLPPDPRVPVIGPRFLVTWERSPESSCCGEGSNLTADEVERLVCGLGDRDVYAGVELPRDWLEQALSGAYIEMFGSRGTVVVSLEAAP
jgi:hypothetical protein